MKYSLLILLSIYLLVGCHANDPAPNKNALLTAHKWQLTEYTQMNINAAGVVTTTTNALAQYAPNTCVMDNSLRFQDDATVSYDTGSQHCYSSELSTYTGKWYLSDDERFLLLSNISHAASLSYISGGIERFELLELTTSTLKLQLRSINASGAVVFIKNITMAPL